MFLGGSRPMTSVERVHRRGKEESKCGRSERARGNIRYYVAFATRERPDSLCLGELAALLVEHGWRERTDCGNFPKWRATVGEDRHNCFAVAL
jgi:hypothetical protein